MEIGKTRGRDLSGRGGDPGDSGYLNWSSVRKLTDLKNNFPSNILRTNNKGKYFHGAVLNFSDVMSEFA